MRRKRKTVNTYENFRMYMIASYRGGRRPRGLSGPTFVVGGLLVYRYPGVSETKKGRRVFIVSWKLEESHEHRGVFGYGIPGILRKAKKEYRWHNGRGKWIKIKE